MDKLEKQQLQLDAAKRRMRRYLDYLEWYMNDKRGASIPCVLMYNNTNPSMSQATYQPVMRSYNTSATCRYCDSPSANRGVPMIRITYQERGKEEDNLKVQLFVVGICGLGSCRSFWKEELKNAKSVIFRNEQEEEEAVETLRLHQLFPGNTTVPYF